MEQQGCPGPAGAEIICRTSNGEILMAMAAPLGITTSATAETWGLLIAARITVQQQWPKVWFEMDSMAVIQLQQQQPNNHPWYLKRMLSEIKTLMQEIPLMKIQHAYTKANQTSDELANQAVKFQTQNSSNPTSKI